MLSIAGVEFELQQSDRGAILVKAGKPCGRGWIAEKKRCDPAKLQHALKERRGDLERYANSKREAKGLRPKSKPDDISLADLEASDKMLEESLARIGRSGDSLNKFPDRIQSALDAEPTTFEEVLNTIVPFNKGQAKLLGELKSDLMNLTDLAKQFGMERYKRENVAAWEELKGAMEGDREYLAALQDKLIKNKIDQLNRIYKGKLDQSRAKIAATLTRMFHALNFRKQIKMPKGTTQKEYMDILEKLLDGDKKAIKQYTVTRRPSKKKKGK